MSIPVSEIYKIFRDKFSKGFCHGYPVRVSFNPEQDTLAIEIQIANSGIDFLSSEKFEKVKSVFDTFYNQYTASGCDCVYVYPTKETYEEEIPFSISLNFS